MKKQYLAAAAVFCLAMLAWGTQDASPELVIGAQVGALLYPCPPELPPGSNEVEPIRGNCMLEELGRNPPPAPVPVPYPGSSLTTALSAV